ncbi:MAG: hypothetical protein IJE60_07335 [Tyzzerella sp.]|nr:hypothetical protein [Tyzzerella sp.]
MKKNIKRIVALVIALVLLCPQIITNIVVDAANDTASTSLLYSHYTFKDGNYNNHGSSSLSAKTGTEIGGFDNALLGNAWIGDHTNETIRALGKGFTSTNAVEIPNDALTFSTFTASAWFACAHIDGKSNAGTVQRIMGNGGYGNTSGWYVSVLVQNNGNTFIGCNIGGATGKTEFIDVTATKGVYLNYGWHNVVLVADRANNQAHVYLDGELLKSIDTQDSWYNDAAANAYIGGYKDGENVVEGFCGFISDVQSVNRAATATQVAEYVGAASVNSETLLSDQFRIFTSSIGNAENAVDFSQRDGIPLFKKYSYFIIGDTDFNLVNQYAEELKNLRSRATRFSLTVQSDEYTDANVKNDMAGAMYLFGDSIDKYSSCFWHMSYANAAIKQENAISDPDNKIYYEPDYSIWNPTWTSAASYFKENNIRTYWEVWNEPDQSAWTKFDWDGYIRMYQNTANALRDADKDAMVGGISASHHSNLNLTEDRYGQFLDAMMQSQTPVDFVSFHDYEKLYNNEIPFIEAGLSNRADYYAKTQIMYTEFNVHMLEMEEWYKDYSERTDFTLQKSAIVPVMMQAIEDLNGYTDVSVVQWAALLQKNSAFAIIDSEGNRSPAYWAQYLYAHMPVERVLASNTEENIQVLASSDEGKSAVMLCNSGNTDVEYSLDLTNIPYETYNAVVYRIDKEHTSYLESSDGSDELLPVGQEEGLTSQGLNWTGNIPAGGTVYIEFTSGETCPLEENNEVGDIVRTDHYYKDRTAKSYSDFDDQTATAIVGTGNNAQGRGCTAVTLRNVSDAISVTGKLRSQLASNDTNSFAGVRVDYHTSAGYTYAVQYVGDIKGTSRTSVVPFGTERVADRTVDVNLEEFEMNIAGYAPSGWDGQVIITFDIENTGANTEYKWTMKPIATETETLLFSKYSFDGGRYDNTGSSELSDKTGTEIGEFNTSLLPNQWIGDHANSTTNGLGKGFSSINAVEIPNDALTFDTFTASAWFASQHIDGKSNAGTVQRIMGNGGYGDVGGWYVSVLVQNNGNTYIGCNIGGASGITEFIDVTATKGIYLGNTWHNIMLVADRANNKAHVYLDGELLKSIDTQDSWYNDAAANAYIGGYKDGENVVEGFCGFISDVQSVNCALTATQVANYVGAAVTDSGTLLTDCIATLLGNSVTLDGNIGLNYYMHLGKLFVANNDTISMHFTIPGVETQIVSDCLYDDAKKAYVYTCNVPAKHMADDVTAQLFVGENVYSDGFSISVKEYVNILLKDATQVDAIKNLATTLLHYGAYSQRYFNYNTEKLANEGLTSLNLDEITQNDFSTYHANSVLEAQGFGEIAASKLQLKSETALTVYIQLSDNIQVDDYQFNCDGKTITPGTYGEWVTVTIPNIAAHELDDMFVITAVNKTNEEETYQFEYSVFNYVYNALNDSYAGREHLKELVKVLYKYNEAANQVCGE